MCVSIPVDAGEQLLLDLGPEADNFRLFVFLSEV